MNVLLVDDHPLVHEVLRAVVQKTLPHATMMSAGDLGEAFEHARTAEKIDLVLLDLGLPACSGLDALIQFRGSFPQLRVLVVSATEDRMSVFGALDAGAVGYVPKTHTPPLIAAALRLVVEGGTYIPPQVLHRDDSASHGLTDRQLDVLRLIAKGLANKEIARRLRIAKDTVKQHAKAVYAMLGVGTRGEAARAAQRRGINLE
jgi:two-component system, NarL family, nitrate/nitrite response regulator NarL